MIGEAKFKEGVDGDSDDSEAEDRKRKEILEEVLAEMHDPYFISPVIIPKLRGEGIINVSASRTHCTALTDGGDLFVWGSADGGALSSAKQRWSTWRRSSCSHRVASAGMLGLGGVKDYVEEPKELKTIISSNVVRQAAVGTSHSAAITTSGKVGRPRYAELPERFTHLYSAATPRYSRGDTLEVADSGWVKTCASVGPWHAFLASASG